MPNHFFLSHLCVSSLLWRTRPIESAAETMMRLGLRHLELSASPLAPLHYQPDGNNSRLFNVLAEAGVSVAALRLTGLDYHGKIRAIAEAGERGIPAVLDRVEPLAFPDLLDRVRTYSFCAARAGVHFILENDSHTSCDNAEALLTVRRHIPHTALGFGFAPPHALADKRDPIEEIRSLGSALRLAYLWDASEAMVPGRDYKRFYAGPPEDQTPGNERGRMNWPEYFQVLAEVGFRGIFNLNWLGSEDWGEWQTEEAIVESVRFCGELATRAGLGD